MANPSNFSSVLLDWHQSVDRYLPWKEEKDVFYIWLSEIILQQTRVEQGIPYYLKFKNRFKNVHELASASDEELMKLWEGLGYYSRARNLHQTAKQIAANGGNFPKTYEGLLDLKGIGPYTAAAIASFAYDQAVPVIDGNVNRVISRIFGIVAAIDSKEGKNKIKLILSNVFDVDQPASFNQAIMDFGALHCTPKSPKCNTCPFKTDCVALISDMINFIPHKAKKIKKRERILHYLIARDGPSVVLNKRLEKDIWKHLYEFILREEQSINKDQIADTLNAIGIYDSFVVERSTGPYKHVLTHQNLKVYFHHLKIRGLKLKNGVNYFLEDRENLRKFAFPKIIDWYLDENSIYLK